MDPVAEIVDTWLLEDRLLPRKDRRNAVAIFKQLQKDHGFKGGERTVREYIQKRRGELFKGESSTYVELEHPVGEAQADFGTIHCVRDGKIVEVKSLVLSFPRSNAGFAVPVPSENTECFLEGLRTLFEQAGGVPRRLVLDNASAAVASIGEGEERVLTEAFSRFQLHHRFEADFCGPARGNEKGNVENKDTRAGNGYAPFIPSVVSRSLASC
jgi:transposase